ncbi:hypothetical protein IFM89_022034 [Coptis chinensis]|uniref:Uncharacterized protein n=1 Tax=Coptis chinensis TaxID=261450 RepID=A0A835I4C1_9MAGN|nr:hypothetical protein IFM89_022034 [Coptis chinensis]
MTTEILSDYSAQKKSGCGIQGLYNGVFGRRSTKPRRTLSTSSIPIHKISSIITNLKIRRAVTGETALLDSSNSAELPSELVEKCVAKTTSYSKITPSHQRKPSHGTNTSSTSSSSTSSNTISKAPSTSGLVQGRRLSKDSSCVSEMLDGVSVSERSKGSNSLVRASSGNITPLNPMGNLRKPGIGNSNSSEAYGIKYTISTSNTNSVMGNIVRKTNEHEAHHQINLKPGSNYKALYKRLDPETFKVMGNDEYKKGRYPEALTLYDQAIALNHENASYRSNKSAALMGLGRLFEAAFECQEAIRIDPFYRRAHHRLATLYYRLGEAEKALNHYRQSGFEVTTYEISKAQALKSHLDNSIEAKKIKDWHKMLNETERAVSLGADSAPQVFSFQAEALLKLHRHEDADSVLTKRLNFDVDDCTKFFGPTGNAQILLIRAQVDMASGRFDEAMVAAQRALRLDSSNSEVSSVVRMIQAVSSARSSGNKLFKASEFAMASMAYAEGLEHERFNSVLLCNRAACRIKLGQYEKAMEDCTNALNVRPSYSKARLRRAECNAKMERWEAAIQDYEILTRESPRDEEMGRAQLEAQVQLKKQRSEHTPNMKFSADVVAISSNECFTNFVTSPVKFVDVQG